MGLPNRGLLLFGAVVGLLVASPTAAAGPADASPACDAPCRIHLTFSGEGSGRVVSTWMEQDGRHDVTCRAACVVGTDFGVTVTMTAIPDEGSVFGSLVGPGGCEANTEPSCTFFMDFERDMAVAFAGVGLPQPPSLPPPPPEPPPYVPPPPPTPVSTLPSASCTIVGTEGDDDLDATEGNDVICGRGGNDHIHVGGGYDLVYGGLGDDEIEIGFGRSSVYGGPGADRIEGGSGADLISGGAGNDLLRGRAGADRLLGDRVTTRSPAEAGRTESRRETVDATASTAAPEPTRRGWTSRTGCESSNAACAEAQPYRMSARAPESACAASLPSAPLQTPSVRLPG